jgi:hypothetical protein
MYTRTYEIGPDSYIDKYMHPVGLDMFVPQVYQITRSVPLRLGYFMYIYTYEQKFLLHVKHVNMKFPLSIETVALNKLQACALS